VTLPSRADSKSGMQMAMKDRQKPAPRRHCCKDVSEMSEGSGPGSVGRLIFSSATIELISLVVGEGSSGSVGATSVDEAADERGESSSDEGILI
jgi:hypothetical protein